VPRIRAEDSYPYFICEKCSIVNSRTMTASPTVIALDFVEARQVLAESSAEGRVADEVIRIKLVLTHEEIFNSSVQAGKG